MRAHPLRSAAALIVALVVAFVVVPGALLGLSLARASRHLAAATTALRTDDLDSARVRIERALSAASSAHSMSTTPVLGAAASVVGLRDDLRALEALAGVVRDGARAGVVVLEQAGIDGDAPASLGASLYRDGRIDLDAVHRLQEAVSAAAAVLERSQATIAAAPDPALGIVDDALARAGEELGDAGESAATAASVLEVLPGLAGEGGQRRYLLAFQSPSEARGGGGLIGVYGVLAARDGRLTLEHVGPIEELVARLDATVDAPKWFEDLYGNFRGASEFRQANMSPHFPTTAQVWLQMYRRAEGVRLDGVLALDPFALGELTRGTGPLRAEGWDRDINRTNVRRVLLHDVYRHFDYKERIQNQYLRSLVDVLWDRLESPDLRAGATLRGVAAATSRQRIKMFSRVAHEQAVLAEVGAAGDYTTAGRSVQMLFNNNFAANKVDFFLHRTTATTVSLRPDGSARVDVEITLANEAPTEPGSVLVRPLRDELVTGLNDMTLHLLMPQGSEPTELAIDGADTNILVGREGPYPVAWQLVEIEPQETAVVRLSYRWPGAVAADGSFELSLWPQATARPDRFTLEVAAPDGSVLVSRKGAAERVISVSGRLQEPVTFSWDVTPARAAD